MAASFTIKLIFSDHWDSFQLKYPNIRPVVSYEVERVLGCGDPRNGFALYECPRCFRKRFVPFRCHSRFCSTCGSAYQDDRAASIEEKLINCRHRHVVFTIAEELRPNFRKYRNMLHVLFRSAAQVIQEWALAQNKKEQFQFGMVCVLHTFGRDLKWNPHIHMLLTEGACGKISPWKSFHYFPYVMLRKRWMTTLLYNLRQEILSSNLSDTHFLNLVNRFYRIYKDGFYVHAPKSDFNSASAVTKYIVRYIGRPAMAQSRIINYDGSRVTFWYQRHEDNEKVVECVPAHDFIKRLIIHIPEKGFHMLRYYGLYAQPFSKNTHLFRRIHPDKKSARKLLQRWAFRISVSFGIDPLKCHCGTYMHFIETYYPFSPAHSPPFMVQ